MALDGQQLHSEFILERQLREYAAQDLYPMHMPGHKRQEIGVRFGEPAGAAAGLPYGWDVTEVSGTDDLHDAGGILREAMDRTAALYGAARTWYLVNGSTCGLLAGIRAIAPYGSEVIVARNCHKAVYHAIELQNLTVHWIWPTRDAYYDIYESVSPEAVESMLMAHPAAEAVILTSPTYEGIVSDIRRIAEVCHAHRTAAHPDGIPLLVDEAHGAHLGFHEAFPDTAIHLGADIVVQSPHKTLPSLTQTAWMHIPAGSRVKAERIEQELDIFETSSPSYSLMASLDACTGILREHGRELFAAYAERLDAIIQPMAEGLQGLRILGYSGQAGTDADHSGLYAHDPSKILISANRRMIGEWPYNGAELAELLRETYRIETEMHLGWNVLAMTSICDTEEGLRRLADALRELDRKTEPFGMEPEEQLAAPVAPAVMTIAEAASAPREIVPEEAAKGRIAAEYVYCYPPGIPVIVPGERITRDALWQLEDWTGGTRGATVHHSGRAAGYCVVKE